MKIIVVNGPNINMLGIREPEIYGNKTYKELVKEIIRYGKDSGVKIKCFQSNFEGEIVSLIQKSLNKYDGIIINAGALTHTSIAILDALKSVSIPTVEVHLSDITKREEFRNKSYVSLISEKTFQGMGFAGYFKAIDYLKIFLQKNGKNAQKF